MDEGMRVVIGADTSGAEAGLKKFAGALDILKHQLERLNRLALLPNLDFKQQERLSGLIRKTSGEIGKMQESLKRAAPAASSASFALQNLGRVAQDSSFGFIGVANNLNPLLESFQRLRLETGSGKAALAALGSSLMGAGGLGLALSAVTAILQFSQIGFSAWTRGMDGSKKKLEETKEVVADSITQYEKYVQKLNEVIEASSKEAAKVSILFDALGATNLKLEERKSIISQLNSISGKYLGHLDSEKSSYIEISKAVEDYLKNIATATELKALLPEFEKIIQKMIAAQVELNQISRQRDIALKLDLFPAEDERDFQAQKGRLLNIIKGAQTDIRFAKKVMSEMAGSGLALEELLFGKQDQKLSKDRIDKVKDDLEEQLKQLFRTSTIIKPTGEQTTLNRMFRGILDDWDEFTEELKAPKGAVLPIKEIIIDPIEKAKKEFGEKLKSLNDTINNSIQSLIVPTIEGLARTLGEAFGGGGFKAAIGGFLSLIGDALITVGKAAIQAGVQMLALKEALTLLFKTPTAAIAAGVLMIALGSLIKTKIPKFAEGGFVTKPTLLMAGEKGPEGIFNMRQMQALFGGGGSRFPEVIEFRQRGRDLVAVVEMGQRSLNRIT